MMGEVSSAAVDEPTTETSNRSVLTKQHVQRKMTCQSCKKACRNGLHATRAEEHSMRFCTLYSSSPEKDSPSSVSEKVSRSKSSTSPWNIGSFFKKKKSSPHGPYFFGMFHLLAIVRIPTTSQGPRKGHIPSRQGPAQTFRKPFVLSSMISSSSSPFSSLPAQTSMSLS